MSKSKSVPLHSHGPSYHDEDKPVHYFPLNELLYIVEHAPDADVHASLTSQWLDEILRNQKCGYQLPGNVSESLQPLPGIFFPASPNKPVRFTIFTVRSSALNVIDEFNRFYAMDPRYQGISFNAGIIRWVLPNWFNGAAPHVGIGPHGPGGPPRPVKDPAVINRLRISVKSSLQTTAKASAKPGKVVVYILDTIPNKCRIQNALSTWPLLKQHFEKILDVKPVAAASTNSLETTQATYHYVDPADFYQTYFHDNPNDPNHPYALGNHEYDSSDHGLFIAGIAHLFAPDVSIHVIQVMNEFGIGTFTNFANGFRTMVQLHQALNNPGDKPKKIPVSEYQAIVNCSFTLSIPIDQHAPHRISVAQRKKLGISGTLVSWIKANQTLFDEQMKGLIEALNASLDTGAIILAASGNDSVAGQQKKARYPAKFKKVIGVGALKRDGSRADYSNEDDEPQSDGVYVFGGDYANNAVSGEGIISIFTGNLNIDLTGSNPPPVHPGIFDNPTGYAEWKGTSFATPVIAGTLARISRLRNKNPRLVYDDDIKPLADPTDRSLVAVTIRHSP